jgi:hypothetical protein
MRLFEVHAQSGHMIVAAEEAYVDASGALVFTVRERLRPRSILALARGEWRAFHYANAYGRDAQDRNAQISPTSVAKLLGVN